MDRYGSYISEQEQHSIYYLFMIYCSFDLK